jgi:large subunit ribosomal protein L9
MSAVEVILLERVDNLGDLGETVNVKPGFARNFLFPQGKALRATKSNLAYFDAQKKEIEKKNEANRKEAEKRSKSLEGLTINIIRHASESGQLYGSVSSRDIVDAISENTKEKLARNTVDMNQAYKTIGLFPVVIALHPEVKVELTINIARSEDEAKLQAKTGKALVAENDAEEQAPAAASTIDEDAADEAAAAAKAELMEKDALEAETAKAAEDAEKTAEDEAKAAAKAEAKAAKKAEEAEAETSEGETADAAESDDAEETKE